MASTGSVDAGLMNGMKDTIDRLVNRLGSMEVAVEKLTKPVKAVQPVVETYCICCGGGDHVTAVCPLTSVGEYEQPGELQEVQYVQQVINRGNFKASRSSMANRGSSLISRLLRRRLPLPPLMMLPCLFCSRSWIDKLTHKRSCESI